MSKGNNEPPSVLICIFVSRGPSPQEAGQGHDLLFYTPPSKRAARASPNEFEFVQVDQMTGVKDKIGEAVTKKAHQMIAKNLLLDAKKDLRLVRRSKRILWTDGSFLEAFLFRLPVSYERGRVYEMDRVNAEKRNSKSAPPEGVDEKAYETDLATYRLISARMGFEHHSFKSADFLRTNPTPFEFINTAYHLVFLPSLLERSLDVFSNLSFSLPSADVAELALNIIFEMVSNKSGRQAFTFWAPGVPLPTQQTKTLPEAVLKYRLFAFWTDVVAHYLRMCNLALRTVVSSTLLRTLAPLERLVSDPSTSVDKLEKQALIEIAVESQRSSSLGTVIDKLTVNRILHRPFSPTRGPLPPKREALTVFSLGDSVIAYAVLAELIYQLLIASYHPYSSLATGFRHLTRDEEMEWLNRPKELKVVIAETRPSFDGVRLAQKLTKFIDTSKERGKELRGLAIVKKPGERDAILPESLRERLKSAADDDSTENEIEKAWTALHLLMKRAEPRVEPSSAAKISLTVIADTAVHSQLKANSGDSTAIILGAERIRSNGEVLASIGASTLATLAKSCNARVFIVAPTEVIESQQVKTKPPVGTASDFVQGWPSSLDDFKSSVKAVVPLWEEIDPKCIDVYITENGFLSKEGISALAKEKDEVERKMFGVDD